MKFELGPGMKCDLAILMESRLLIQAQSGGGKSRTLRRILEQTHDCHTASGRYQHEEKLPAHAVGGRPA